VALITGHGRFDRTLSDIGLTEFDSIDGTDGHALAALLEDPDTLATYDIVFFDAGHTEMGILYSVSTESKSGDSDTGEPSDTGDPVSMPDTGETDTGTGSPTDTGDLPDTGSGSDTAEAPDTGEGSDTGETPDTGGPAPLTYDTDAIVDNLRSYVTNGGTIYAVDWAYDVIELTFPEAIDFSGSDETPDAAQQGLSGTLDASVDDEGLSEWVQSTSIPVEFHLAEWPVVEATTGKVYLSADAPMIPASDGYVQISAPLLLTVPQGDGALVLSAFRMGPGANAQMRAATQFALIELTSAPQ